MDKEVGMPHLQKKAQHHSDLTLSHLRNPGSLSREMGDGGKSEEGGYVVCGGYPPPYCLQNHVCGCMWLLVPYSISP